MTFSLENLLLHLKPDNSFSLVLVQDIFYECYEAKILVVLVSCNFSQRT